MGKDKYSYQIRMGRTRPSHIPKNILKKRNKEQSWVKGYDSEYDVVILSNDGTISQPYELQNLKICTPAIPTTEKDIRGHKLTTDNQVWTPFIVPSELRDIENETISWNADKTNRNNIKTPTELFYMKPKSFIDKYLKFINDDFERRENGVWQYICGKPTWITSSHYFMLQHSPIQGSTLPDFRFTNLDYWMFWEAIKVDYRALGLIYLKNRRSGASTMAGSECINIGTDIPEGFIGIVSKTNRDSVSFMNKMVIRPFKKLVWYMKPMISGTTSAASGLTFREPPKKMSSKNTVVGVESGLDTVIKQFPTSLNSLDGERTDFAVFDEAGKYPTDVPFDTYWSIVEECLVNGFKVVGKAMVVSTVNSYEKGGRGYKEIYYASDVRKRMSNERTNTGLYSFFIPAEWNQDGGYDKFGYSIVNDPMYAIFNRENQLVKKGNLSRLVEKGDSLKNQSAALYNEFLRKHPRTEQHAFRNESMDSDFNLNKIYEQMDHNEMLTNPYERGNFINLEKEEGKYKIDWIPSRYGRFYLRWMPPPELRNNFEYRGGNIVPLNDFGLIGIDTYKTRKTVDSRGGSKGGASGVTDVSMFVEEIPSDFFFLEYLERPATLENFFQDMVYSMLFYGLPALIENNVDNMLLELKKRNMTRFSMRRTDKLKLSPDEKNLGGISMTGEKVRNEHYFAIQRYIERHVGIDDEGKERDKGQIGSMGFNRTLDSWSKFAPDNRTSEDLSISSGLALLGLKMRRKKIKPTKIVRDTMQGLFGQQYDYSKSNIGKY